MVVDSVWRRFLSGERWFYTSVWRWLSLEVWARVCLIPRPSGAVRGHGPGRDDGSIREGQLEFRLHRQSQLERLGLLLVPHCVNSETSTNKMRKITHLTTVHPPFDVRIFHKECKSIARAGYDVTLIACHDRDEMREGVRIRALPKVRGRLSRMICGSLGHLSGSDSPGCRPISFS